MAKHDEQLLLNATGESWLKAAKQENALLAMMAGRKRAAVYSDISQVADIVRGGYGKENFFLGDQMLVPWWDVDAAVDYQVPVDILGHGMYELEDGEIVPGMAIQWHFCSPFGAQFSHQQAFMNCPDGLAARTYYVTLGATWGSNAKKDAVYSFTLTQAVPAGGRLSGFEGMPDVPPANWNVMSWATPDSASPMETVSVVAGANGTDLGTIPFTVPTDTMNGMQQVAYGNNRWSTSAIRQYLNSRGLGWWASKSNFDIRPNEYTKHGFMDGFGEDFLAAIKPVKVTTALNTVEGYSAASESTFDRFFLPSLEEMHIAPQAAGVEGSSYPYWDQRLGLSTPAAQYGTYPRLITTAINAQTFPQYVRLRSALRGYACYPWLVHASGGVSGYDACSAFRFSPVCVIC